MNKVGFRQISSLSALALAMALSAGSAQACSIDAWTTSSGSPIAGGPLEGNAGSPTRAVQRYMGLCGLQAAANGNSFVAVDHGQAEDTYRARFYFYASSTASATVMQSYSDAGATTPVITVTYNPGASTISATVPGSTLAAVPNIVPNRWYGVEVTRIVGQPASLAVRGGGGGGVGGNPAIARQSVPLVNATVNGAGNATGTGVRLTRLGAIGATTGAISVDEFEASRGGAPVGFRVRADANNSNTVDAGDIAAVARESVTPGSFLGAADCNENGAVEPGDIACTARVSVGL